MAVLLDFFLQVTAFVALIVFDCLRAEDNRIDCFPCIKIPSSGGESDEGILLVNNLYFYVSDQNTIVQIYSFTMN